jgi:hypothetical protein
MPTRLAENLYVLLNPTLPPPRGKLVAGGAASSFRPSWCDRSSIPSRVYAFWLDLALVPAALAVYAPSPDRDPEKDLTVSVRAGFTYDANLFGAARNALDTGVWTFAPKVAYTGSLTDTTYVGAGYAPTFDYFTDRPGAQLLPSHEVSLRLAHAFTKENHGRPQ